MTNSEWVHGTPDGRSRHSDVELSNSLRLETNGNGLVITPSLARKRHTARSVGVQMATALKVPEVAEVCSDRYSEEEDGRCVW